MESKVYNQKGKEVGSVNLPENIFGLTWNADMVHETITSLLSSRRTNLAHTKDRGEVSGGGKKPWQQKGLGRARHGSIRSPIWVGGGVAHGPRNEKNYVRKINKKVKIKVLFTILSQKIRDGEIFFLDQISMEKPKTKDALEVLKGLGTIKGCEKLVSKKNNAAYIAVTKKNEAVAKSFRNLGNVFVDEVRNINPVDLLNYKFIFIENPEESMKFLAAKTK